MGNVRTITSRTFPKQGSCLGKRVEVFFHYDTSTVLNGECVRDDIEEPFRAIFKLDDGRFVLADECQYSDQ